MANRHNITFNTTAEYNTFKNSENYVEPNVSYIRETNEVQYNPYVDPDEGHEYVDLGLPSGTKWATMNVGASNVTDYGNYYKYGLGASQYDNAQTDYSGEEDPLAASADTATQEWGEQWHMPTSAQCQELIDNTTFAWVTDYQGSGINGGTFTANGQTLFIPAAGTYEKGSQIGVDEAGSVWSSTPYESDSAYRLDVGNNGNGVFDMRRRCGSSVRPVAD